MMKRNMIIGGSITALALIAAVTPYLVGLKAEKSLRAEHAILAQELVIPGLEISLEDYHRGYLGAEAVTAIIYTPEAEDATPIRLELRHHISHLPNLAHFAIASATSELVLPPEIQAVANKYLKGQPPLTIKSYIRFTGTQVAFLDSPAFKAPLGDKTTVEWKGIAAHSTRSGNSNTITNDVTMPGAVVTSDVDGFSFNDMHYKTDMKRGSYDLWFGTSQASVKSLQFSSNQVNDTRNVAINDLHLNSEQKEEGPVTNGNVVFQFGKSRFDDMNVESALYDFEYRNFDTKTLSDLQTTIKQAYTGNDEAMLGAAILGSLPSLLKTKPEINVRRFEVKSSLGNFNGKFHLAFAGEWNDGMMRNPMAILPMLNADLDISVTKTLLVSLGRSEMRSSIADMAEMQGEDLTAEEIDAMAQERATQQLEVLAANEYLLDKGDLYTTKIHFEKGQLTINGKSANELLGPTVRSAR